MRSLVAPLFCIAVLFPLWAAPIDRAEIRVALMTFTVDDNSYRSAMAAADLATLLQAKLSNEPGIRWVERDELKAAEREFELSKLGLPDKTGALRRGQYTAADWIVTGAFSAATNQQWLLRIEIIDARHTDILATKAAVLSRDAHPTLKSALPQLSSVAMEVRAGLAAASNRWEQVRNRRTLALLMMLDAEETEPGIAHALENPNGVFPAWRVVRFLPGGPSSTENELSLLGLAKRNGSSWDKLADVYAWGRLANYGKPPSKPLLELTVWNGQGQPQTVSVEATGITNAATQLPTFVPGLLEELAPIINDLKLDSRATDVRERIAESLFQRAQSWRHNPEHQSRWRNDPNRWVQEEELQQVRLFDTAFFFDPQHAGAYESALRWRTRRSSHEFLALKTLSDGWGDYVARFGFSSIAKQGGFPDWVSVEGLYVGQTYRLVDLSALGNKEDRGFPRDMSGVEAKRWLKGFTTELAHRIIKTAGEPTTRALANAVLRDGLTGNPQQLMMVEPKLRRQCIEALWPSFAESVPPGHSRRNYNDICESVSATYAELGIADQTEKLFAMLDKPAKTKVDGVNLNKSVRLPPADELDPLPRFRK